MKVAIIQHEIRENNIEWNFQQLSSLIDKQPGADLYVLAETFATGFLAEGSTQHAAVEGPQILSWMQQQASRINAAIAGSVATVDEEGKLRNRMYLFVPMVPLITMTSAICSRMPARIKIMLQATVVL